MATKSQKDLKINLLTRIKTPDGTILTSARRHDFVKHHDTVTNEEYILDGGLDYCRETVNKVPAEHCNITLMVEDWEEVRSHHARTNYKGETILLKDMSDAHLRNSVIYNIEKGFDTSPYTLAYLLELKYREANGISIVDPEVDEDE